jgi:hypothetical protein
MQIMISCLSYCHLLSYIRMCMVALKNGTLALIYLTQSDTMVCGHNGPEEALSDLLHRVH